MEWLEERIRDAAHSDSGRLQIMYGIDGRADLPEQQLAHLEGYMGCVVMAEVISMTAPIVRSGPTTSVTMLVVMPF